MPLTPRSLHTIEQVGAAMREVAREVAAVRQEYIDGGMPEVEASALAAQVQSAMLAPLLESAEKTLNDEDGKLERGEADSIDWPF